MSAQVPYQNSRQVCTQNQLWSYTHTVPVYPWVEIKPVTFIGVRAGLEGLCDNLDVNEPTVNDLEMCEVVCQPTNITECAKVVTGTNEEGKEIWEDEQDNCVELEKTECRVQEREAGDGERAADTDDEEDITSVYEEGDMATSTTNNPVEIETDESVIIFPG